MARRGTEAAAAGKRRAAMTNEKGKVASVVGLQVLRANGGMV